MKTYIAVMAMALVTLLTGCQKKDLSPTIEGVYSVNNYTAWEKYNDPTMCLMCGPREIFPANVELQKVSESYNLQIKGERYKKPLYPLIKESYNHTFQGVLFKVNGNISNLSFQGKIIGKIENKKLQIFDLIFEEDTTPNPFKDTKYVSLNASK
jgi:hypothetical protein